MILTAATARRTARNELENFLDRSTDLFDLAILDLAREKFLQRTGKGDQRRVDAAFSAFTTLLQHTLVLSHLYGARRTLREARSLGAAQFHKGDQWQVEDVEIHTPLNQNLTFLEAVDELIHREPKLAANAEEVSKLYAKWKVFAMARSTSLEVTEKVQRLIVKTIQEGKGLADVETEIAKLGNWTRAYSATVYRTNASTAYAAGRMRQAFDPEVKEFVGALERRAIKDSRTRHNHLAADGLVAAVDDPIWNSLGVPGGYQ